eukprot:3831812-Amphidinium_carterae.1
MNIMQEYKKGDEKPQNEQRKNIKIQERQVRDQEELDRQAATSEVPEEQVAQEPEEVAQQAPPIIGGSAQTISSTSTVSSSTGASTRLERQERQDSADYWENIIEI